MLKKLNAAMDYIEAHLEEVAAGVGISDLSFRQLFYALTGMTLQEYVKNLPPEPTPNPPTPNPPTPNPEG